MTIALSVVGLASGAQPEAFWYSERCTKTLVPREYPRRALSDQDKIKEEKSTMKKRFQLLSLEPFKVRECCFCSIILRTRCSRTASGSGFSKRRAQKDCDCI